MVDEATLHLLRTTDRTFPMIADISEHIAELSPADVTQLMEYLIAEGEDKAMGILLNAVAFLRMHVDPHILSQTLKVVEDIDDFTYPFRDQDEKAIDPLLEMAFARELSTQRNVLAAILAAELAVKWAVQHSEVKKVLHKLRNKYLPTEGSIYVHTALDCLEKRSFQDAVLPQLLKRDIHQELPQERPPRYIAQDETVRRPVPKTGRNDPCHCGSGKKYKKCCLCKDEERFYDASPYAGLTKSQVMSSPGLVEGADVIYNMRAYHIKKLNPVELNEDQLFAAYRQADVFGLHKIAWSMLLELRNRPGKSDFAEMHMHDLLHATLEAGNLELSKEIKSTIPEEELKDEHVQEFHMRLLEHQEQFMLLEKQCQKSLTNNDMASGNNLVDLTHCFEPTFPALSIVFARSAILERPSAVLDNEILLEVLRNARTELDLDIYADPIEDFLEEALDKQDQDSELEEKEREISELKQKIAEGRRNAVHKDRELQEKERELKILSKKLEQGSLPGPTQNVQPEKAGDQSRQQEDAVRLKRRIEQLKMEIREQQQERRRLHQELESKRKTEDQRALAQRSEQDSPSEGEEDDDQGVCASKQVHIPVYTEQFKKSCKHISAGIVAKALRAATGFAVNDQQVLRQSRQVEKLSSIYRVRVGMNYRLLVRRKKGEDLEVLDLITRQDLDTWINTRKTDS